MKKIMQTIFCMAIFFCLTGYSTNKKDGIAKVTAIRPGETWPDNNGNHVQAHGGGIIKIKDTYYWYGEERSQGLDSNNALCKLLYIKRFNELGICRRCAEAGRS